MAISIMEDIASLEARQEHLLKANPTALDEIQEVQFQLATSKRLLQRHGVVDEMKRLKLELQQHEVFCPRRFVLCRFYCIQTLNVYMELSVFVFVWYFVM